MLNIGKSRWRVYKCSFNFSIGLDLFKIKNGKEWNFNVEWIAWMCRLGLLGSWLTAGEVLKLAVYWVFIAFWHSDNPLWVHIWCKSSSGSLVKPLQLLSVYVQNRNDEIEKAEDFLCHSSWRFFLTCPQGSLTSMHSDSGTSTHRPHSFWDCRPLHQARQWCTYYF